MDPWNQLCFMDLVHVGEFVLAYLLNPTSYGHETCTIGYSKDWGLKGCVKVLWQPHQIWSYGPVKSAIFHGLVWVGWFVVPYLLNPTSYGHETCTMVSHTMIILALFPIPTHPPDYTLIIKLCLYLMLEPWHTNLTFTLTFVPVWNSLPDYIVNSTSPSAFKSWVTAHFVNPPK